LFEENDIYVVKTEHVFGVSVYHLFFLRVCMWNKMKRGMRFELI